MAWLAISLRIQDEHDRLIDVLVGGVATIADNIAACLREDNDKGHQAGAAHDGKKPEDPRPAHEFRQDAPYDGAKAGAAVWSCEIPNFCQKRLQWSTAVFEADNLRHTRKA